MLLLGPFTQALTLASLPLAGALRDEQLQVVSEAGILTSGPTAGRPDTILAVGDFETLRREHPDARIVSPPQPSVVTPGLIDCHTHLVWAGTRAGDFALRNSGGTYLDIAAAGGGIRSTMRATREADDATLAALLDQRIATLAAQGITTAEVKTGYGLSVAHELAHLALIEAAAADNAHGVDLIATCLAAHVCPPEFEGDAAGYLAHLETELLPQLAALPAHRRPRIDAFAEPSTFWGEPLRRYLSKARALGLQLTIHADQFTPGGAALAVELGAQSADHLEHIDEAGIRALGGQFQISNAEFQIPNAQPGISNSKLEIQNTQPGISNSKFEIPNAQPGISNSKLEIPSPKTPPVAVALPGASIGLGEPFTPARRLLDAGACVAIASDWNPGSAPQGQLMSQATTLAVREKLSNAELWAAITFRAAQALGRQDRGRLIVGQRAQFAVWPVADYREISWAMGALQPISLPRG